MLYPSIFEAIVSASLFITTQGVRKFNISNLLWLTIEYIAHIKDMDITTRRIYNVQFFFIRRK